MTRVELTRAADEALTVMPDDVHEEVFALMGVRDVADRQLGLLRVVGEAVEDGGPADQVLAVMGGTGRFREASSAFER
ncbi:hypothetical protein [Streptomyces sp. 135]|uniref:hypothetical protein n=1 Tax=Streptomyces sp. 135 TaxID=2838850 RepID=UPI001CC0F2AE|nr:hypothetical protein [Streptomyces sp. 135]